ncbi:hypothetical protein ACFXP7_06075 [Microbacterium sp. P06]|uniref:hypothetical protein n=1 Tax=Microbacterium sp. P06 TaxID=3366949 RepID=UPI0037467853
MTDASRIDRLSLSVGGLARPELLRRLAGQEVLLNPHAETLLDHAIFEEQPVRQVVVAERTVGDLGLVGGATLGEVFDRARTQGLILCPADAGPYLRMAWKDQAPSADRVMSSGRAPTASLTVAAEPLSEDDDYPKGFYLRVVEGRPWLRGYRCDDEHIWSPDDRFAFCLPPVGS